MVMLDVQLRTTVCMGSTNTEEFEYVFNACEEDFGINKNNKYSAKDARHQTYTFNGLFTIR